MIRNKFLFIVLVTFSVFFSLNIVANIILSKYKFDFTNDKRFTLSDASLNLVSKINEPITFKFFFSSNTASGLPFLKNYAARIKNLLVEYANNSKGKIKLQIIDPLPFSDMEEKAVSYGIKAVPIDQNGNKVYLGLAASDTIDNIRTIPVFTPEREKFTEYEVSRIIYDLNNRKKHTIGVLSSLPIGEQSLFGLPGLKASRAWIVMQQVAQIFNVKIINSEEARIPADIDVLMVVQPNEKFKNEIFESIDKFVLSGKPALFFLDNYPEFLGNNKNKDTSYDVRIDPLLHNWGINITRQKIVADRFAARKIEDKEIKSQVDYIAWLNLKNANLNSDDITTSSLKEININTAGSIENLPNNHLEFVPLIKTSNNSGLMELITIRGERDPNEALNLFHSDNKSYILAARSTGMAKSSFMPNQTGNINIVVVADSDLLRDEVWSTNQIFDNYQLVKPIADNSAFVVNMLENLSGGSDLIALRGRGAQSKNFSLVDKIKKQAEEKFIKRQTELQDKLRLTEHKLKALQEAAKTQDGNAILYKEEQRQEIQNFSSQMTLLKKDLWQVQKELYYDIELLGKKIKLINIIFCPLLVGLVGLLWFIYRMKKSK